MLNKTILILNTLILIVNFAIVFTSSDQQYKILNASMRVPNLLYVDRGSTFQRTELAYYRIMQSLDRFGINVESLTPEQARAIYAAVDHYAIVVSDGVGRSLQRDLEPARRRDEFEALGHRSRVGVSQILAAEFDDQTLVGRLTTEIIKQAG